MTRGRVTFFKPVNKLFLVLPDTEFAEYCIEADKLVQREPKILKLIQEDLKYDAKRKKQARLLDKQWQEKHAKELPGVYIEESALDIEKITLKKGRPRMDDYTAYIFMMGRGYYGGIKSAIGQTFTMESKTLEIFLNNRGIKMPSANSVYDNINAISNETRQFIIDAQIRQIIDEKLDDFKTLIADSTSVSGNVSWPRDSNLIVQLISRTYTRGKRFHKFDIDDIQTRYFPRLTKEINSLSNKINMESGKPGSDKKRRKYYRKLLSLSQEAIVLFEEEMKPIYECKKELNILPSRKAQLQRLIKWIDTDIQSLKKVTTYCHKRVFEGEKLGSKDKIMSLSDPDAAYIQKGNREAKIGYKPQLGRSGNGFISSVIIPKGNLSDSSQFRPIVDQSITRTNIIPNLVSVDDGYVHTSERNNILEMGVKTVSFSGAKGKRVIDSDLWNTQDYQDARNDRSAVESLMFTIKYRFDFDRVVRRGHQNVEAELLEKVLAYNTCRIIQIRSRQKIPLPLAA